MQKKSCSSPNYNFFSRFGWALTKGSCVLNYFWYHLSGQLVVEDSVDLLGYVPPPKYYKLQAIGSRPSSTFGDFCDYFVIPVISSRKGWWKCLENEMAATSIAAFSTYIISITGVIQITHTLEVILREFHGALVGLVSYNDPCMKVFGEHCARGSARCQHPT